MVKLNEIAKNLGVPKGKIKDMILNKRISYEIIAGIYYVDEVEVLNILKSYGNTSSNKKSQKCVNFSYMSFAKNFINTCYFSSKTHINNCNFLISDLMTIPSFNNQNVINYLILKYQNKSEKDIIIDVVNNSLGFNDKRMPNTDYGFMEEYIDGQRILIFCAYLPLNHNKVVFYIGLTYEEFDFYIKNHHSFLMKMNTPKVSTKATNNKHYQAHSVRGHWRNQAYGSRKNPKYKKIWIEDFEKGSKKIV